jgi:hypothetical protein
MSAEVYRYSLTNQRVTSDKLGACQVCSSHVSEVYHQIEERRFEVPEINRIGWTTNKCFSYFGHQQCLESKRRN